MRETGIELAIDEGSAGSLPILVSWGRNGLPPLSVDATPDQWCPAVRYDACEVPKPTETDKLSGVSTRTSSGFVLGDLPWPECVLIFSRLSVTFTIPCFKPIITRATTYRSFTNTWRPALPG
jgi:hypothetical protein